MVKSLFYLFLVLFSLNSLYAQVPEETASIVKVDEYFNMLISHTIDEQIKEYDNYLHPDAILLGGYYPKFFILKGGYEILSVKKEILNLNLMEPKEEEFIVVEILFPAIGRVWLGEFHEESEFHSVFYLNHYNDELVILKRSEQKYSIMSLEDSLNYLFKRNEESDYYKTAYNDLLAYLEEKEIPIP